MIRHVPTDLLLGLIGDRALIEWQGHDFPCAVAVDGGLAVAMPEADPAHTWALTVFEPTQAAVAAMRVLDQRSVHTVGTTLGFGFPIVADPNDLLSFASALRLGASPLPGRWALADERASNALILAGPDQSLTITWWDEYGGLPFAWPVAVAEHRPSEFERTIAQQWGGLPLYDFATNGPTVDC